MVGPYLFVVVVCNGLSQYIVYDQLFSYTLCTGRLTLVMYRLTVCHSNFPHFFLRIQEWSLEPYPDHTVMFDFDQFISFLGHLSLCLTASTHILFFVCNKNAWVEQKVLGAHKHMYVLKSWVLWNRCKQKLITLPQETILNPVINWLMI